MVDTPKYFLFVLSVDDPLDAVAVHLGGGLWGLLGGALLRTDALPVGDVTSAGLGAAYNALGALAISAWAGGACLVLFGALRLAGLLRVSPEEELQGETNQVTQSFRFSRSEIGYCL